MKLDFKRYLMAILFAIMPVVILCKALCVELEWISINFAIVIVLIFISLLSIKNKRIKIITVVAGVAYFLLTTNFGDLYNGIVEISTRYGSLMEKYKAATDVELEIEEIESISAVVRFYISIMIPSLFVVYKNKMWKLVYIDVTIPFIALVLALGLTPSETDIYILAFMYVNLMMENTCKKDTMSLDGRLNTILKNVYVNGILLVIFLIVIFVNSVNPYERSKEFDEYKVTLNQYLSGEKTIIDAFKDTFNFGDGNIAAGGMNNGILGSVDEIKFTGEEKLSVKIYKNDEFDNRQNFYIKSYIGVNYTGNSWESADKKINDTVALIGKIYSLNMSDIDEINTSLFDEGYRMGYSLPGEKERIIIKNLDDDDENVYWPYYAKTSLDSKYDGQKEGNGLNEWSYNIYAPYEIPSPELWNYYVNEWGQYPGGMVDVYMDDVFNKNKLNTAKNVLFDYYRDVASEYYLEIPDSFMDTANKIKNMDITSYLDMRSYGIGDFNHTISKFNANLYGYKVQIDFVKKYLDRNCSYTLSPGKLKSGEDFVNKFLDDTKEGYCVHFASAGTLIFRAIGIPARYVEGYVIRNQYVDNETTITVKDESAHAWVEIFVKGVGWVPVDVTPSYYTKVIKESLNGNNSGNNNNPTKKPEQTTAAKETTTREPEIETTTDKKENPEETTKKETKETTTNPGSDESGNINDPNNSGEDGNGGNGGEGGKTAPTNKNSRGITMFILGCILLTVTTITIICMVTANAKQKQKKYIDILKKGNKNRIYKTFLDQLKKIMALKKIELNLFESTDNIKNKIMEVDPKLNEEDALQVAKIVVEGQYSEEPIDDEELYEMVANIGKMSNHIYEASGFIRKLNLYYIKCLYLSKK